MKFNFTNNLNHHYAKNVSKNSYILMILKVINLNIILLINHFQKFKSIHIINL